MIRKLYIRLIVSAIIYAFMTNFTEIIAQELEIFAVDDFIDPSTWQSSEPSDTVSIDKFIAIIFYGGSIYSSYVDESSDRLSYDSLDRLYNVGFSEKFTEFFRATGSSYLKNYQANWKVTLLSSRANQDININNKIQVARYSHPEEMENSTHRWQFTWDWDKIGDDLLSSQYSLGLDMEEFWGSRIRNRTFSNLIYSYRPKEKAHYLASTVYRTAYTSLLKSKITHSFRISGGGIGKKWRFRPYKFQFLWEIPVDYIDGSVYLFWSPSLWYSFKSKELTTDHELGFYIGTPIYSWLF